MADHRCPLLSSTSTHCNGHIWYLNQLSHSLFPLILHPSCLVPDVLYHIFDLLPVRELLVLSRTCVWLQTLLQDYWRGAFNLSRLLEPFISNEDISEFRQLLRMTQGLISGSAALQLLDRRSFDDKSDLDIYVHHRNSALIYEWFVHHGMMESVHESDGIDVVPDYSNQMNEIDSVINFQVVNSSRIVQLVSTKRDPTLAVLAFHSSTFVHSFFYMALQY